MINKSSPVSNEHCNRENNDRPTIRTTKAQHEGVGSVVKSASSFGNRLAMFQRMESMSHMDSHLSNSKPSAARARRHDFSEPGAFTNKSQPQTLKSENVIGSVQSTNSRTKQTHLAVDNGSRNVGKVQSPTPTTSGPGSSSPSSSSSIASRIAMFSNVTAGRHPPSVDRNISTGLRGASIRFQESKKVLDELMSKANSHQNSNSVQKSGGDYGGMSSHFSGASDVNSTTSLSSSSSVSDTSGVNSTTSSFVGSSVSNSSVYPKSEDDNSKLFAIVSREVPFNPNILRAAFDERYPGVKVDFRAESQQGNVHEIYIIVQGQNNIEQIERDYVFGSKPFTVIGTGGSPLDFQLEFHRTLVLWIAGFTNKSVLINLFWRMHNVTVASVSSPDPHSSISRIVFLEKDRRIYEKLLRNGEFEIPPAKGKPGKKCKVLSKPHMRGSQSTISSIGGPRSVASETSVSGVDVVFNAKQELEKKLKADQDSGQSKIQQTLTLNEDQLVCYKENKVDLNSQFKTLFAKRVSFVVSEKNFVVTFTCRTMKDFNESKKWFLSFLRERKRDERLISIDITRYNFLEVIGIPSELSEQYSVEFVLAPRDKSNDKTELVIRGLNNNVARAAKAIHLKDQEIIVTELHINVSLGTWGFIKEEMSNIADNAVSNSVHVSFPRSEFTKLKPFNQQKSKICNVNIIGFEQDHIDSVKSEIEALEKQFISKGIRNKTQPRIQRIELDSIEREWNVKIHEKSNSYWISGDRDNVAEALSLIEQGIRDNTKQIEFVSVSRNLHAILRNHYVKEMRQINKATTAFIKYVKFHPKGIPVHGTKTSRDTAIRELKNLIDKVAILVIDQDVHFPAGSISYLKSRIDGIKKKHSVQISFPQGTNYTRAISRESENQMGVEAHWFWYDDKHENGRLIQKSTVKKAYALETSRIIEEAYKSGKQSVLINQTRHLDDNAAQYEVLFDYTNGNCIQLNLSTGFCRPVKREEVLTNAKFRQRDENSVKGTKMEQGTNDAEIVRISGRRNDVKAVERALHSLLQKSIHIERIDNIAKLSPSQLDEIARRSKVKMVLIENDSKIEISGRELLVKDAKYDLAMAASSIDGAFEYPNEWEPQNDDIELKSVRQGSQEWKNIENLVHVTLSKHIISIQRVQNKRMWRDYMYHRERLTMDDKNERMLFHGTRNTPPHMIYEGNEGFDFRYAQQGIWGTATYFAENASYSYKYSSIDSPTGYHQFFLARVALGDCIALPPNDSLRMPPEKGRSARGVPVLYDSVQGYTNGSNVFMVYANSRAYPSYLITFIGKK